MAGISRAEKDLLAIINEDPSILDQIPQSRLEELLILLYNKINNGSSHTITVDSELSDTSENPIQNKAVKASIKNIVNGTTQVGSATKATQDAQGNVINETYAKKTEIPSNVSELNNDKSYQTAEEVGQAITDGVVKIVAGAPEDFDTLKEMSDWISSHETSAAAMNSAISGNSVAIANHTSNSDIHVTKEEKTKWNKLDSDLKDGTIIVAEATKATQDAQGNVINETYAKKTEVPHGTVVDDALSLTSTNPVQNKVVKAEFDKVNSNLQEQINNSQTQISNDPSNIITKKIDGIFAEEPFITVPTQTDASLDATAAVQTALTKALLTGKNLFFPKGIYTISERLIIPKSIKVFGASREDTVIKFTGTAKETTPYNPQYYDESNAAILIQANGVEIADLTIEGGTSNTDTSDCYGIAMHRILTKNDKTNYEGSERVALTNVEIRYFKTGLFMFGGWNRYITRCYFRDNAEYGVKYYPLEADSIGNWAGSGDVYIACQFVANLFAGFYAKGLFETTIWNSIFEYNKRAIEVDSCTDICFKNCWNEANIENLKVTGNCKFEGGYNINHRTVDHIVVGGNDLVIFENETLITMYRAGNVVFSQTAGIITKGVEIGVEVDNLLANPGFSEVSGGTGTIPSDAGWYHEGTFEIIEDNPNYVSLSNEGAETDVYRGMWATQEIALSGNTKYNIAAWIKTPDRSSIDSTGIMFYISWKTADGVTILNDNRTIILTADNTWEYHELQVEAPKGAALLKVGYGLTRNGHVYFREPELSVVGSITSSNIYVRKDNSDSNIIKYVDINGNELGSINLSTNASEPETDVINWEEN